MVESVSQVIDTVDEKRGAAALDARGIEKFLAKGHALFPCQVPENLRIPGRI